MKKNPKYESLNTRAIILLAAEEIFAIKGYAAATTAEIAKKAGVNNALLHYHFQTKENLFNHIFKQKMQDAAVSLLKIVEQNSSLEDVIRQGIEAHFDFLQNHPYLPKFVLSEIFFGNHKLSEFSEIFIPVLQKMDKKLSKLIEKDVKAKKIRPITPLDLLLNILSLNVLAHIALPVFSEELKLNKRAHNKLLNQRKKEIVTLIMNGIKINK